MPSDDVVAACQALIERHGSTRLSTRSHAITIAEGYVPLLINYTEEDREAKGLRKLQAGTTTRIAVHDTVLDAASMEPLLFLTGPSGCGKSTSLLYLALHLAGATIDDPRWALEGLERAVPRNDAGTVIGERWSGAVVAPVLIVVESPSSLQELLAGVPLGTDCLLMIGRAERLGAKGPALLRDVAELVCTKPGLRAIVAGEADMCRAWIVPPVFARRRIVPLIDAQRRAVGNSGAGDLDTEVLGNVGLFTLAVESGLPATSSIDVIDRWLDEAAYRNAMTIDALIELGTASYETPDAERDHPAIDEATLHWLGRPFVQRQLAARYLRSTSLDFVGALHRTDPLKWSGPIELVARRLVRDGLSLDPLVSTLLQGAPDYGAIDAARMLSMDAIGPEVLQKIEAALVAIVEQGGLPVALREEAGRALAIHGDPRDLDALIEIAEGAFTMGSTAHPNSAPPHIVIVLRYCIGRYPVTNRAYGAFVAATGRSWRSTDGLHPDRSNAPAVDLTWHDARAYCAWLTTRWQAEGRITANDEVRLPTEPEWERAARGLQADDGLVFPWPGPWQADRTNSEEIGFNDTCTVGLFPAGRSSDGCDDMVGQVWEWTSTLWGEDMATPRFAYPYTDDGREDVDAPADVRRVLRGACFLSPREKANCIYRGSLEPDGFWRGNGFRIVVATA